MTDTKANDPCRVMAEQVVDTWLTNAWKRGAISVQGFAKEAFIDDLSKSISDHTVVPELVRMLENIEAIHVGTILGANIQKLLAKARGIE